MQKEFPIERVLTILKKESKKWDAPIVSLMGARGDDPFLILVSAMLSARTRDQVTAVVTERLFRKYTTPKQLAVLKLPVLEKEIKPVSYYKTKARHLKELARIIHTDFNNVVPRDLETLLTLPGIGRKTANLVLGEAFQAAGITVDTHVHRITNRWGYLKTKSPFETEMQLRKQLPKQWWIAINPIVVAFGQTICQPVSPKCSICPVRMYCPRIGVVKHR